MASRLPDNPSLDKLKSDARRLQRAARSEEAAALDLIQRWHPKPETAAAQGFPLHAGQLTIARRYGFSGWPALVGYLELAVGLGRDPAAADEASLSAADRFCALACLRYDERDEAPRWAAAADLLAADPGIVEEHVWAAAAAGDAAAVRRIVRRDARAANAQGGPHRWPALLYLAYSRVPATSSTAPVEVARMLLDAGADPNAGYLWRGLSTPFTALTGALGEGEQGPGRQPRHPQSAELARLLLDRGADPNDGQALYNRMFTRGNDHLELLFACGLGTGDGGPWRRRLGEAMESPAEMLRRQLDWAIDHQLTDRVRLLVTAGIDLVTPSPDGATPRDRAHTLDYFPVIHQLVLGKTSPTMPGGGPAGTAAAILLCGPAQDRYARAWLTAHPESVEAAKDRFPRLAGSTIATHHDAVDRLAWAGFDIGPAETAAPLPHPSRWGEVKAVQREHRPPPTEESMRRTEADEQGTVLGVLLQGGDEEATRAMLRRRPYAAWLARDRERQPDLIHRAPDAAAIARIAWAGFDVDARADGHTALHQAAWEGDLEKIRALLDAGADPTIADDEHHSTPLGWAEYAYQHEAAELLRGVTAEPPGTTDLN